MISLELIYYRMRDIVYGLEQALEDNEQALYYAEPGDNIVHLQYVVDRLQAALDTARAAFVAIQWLAYETHATDDLPGDLRRQSV